MGGREKKNGVNCYHLYLIQFFSIWLVKYLSFFPSSLFWKSVLFEISLN